jgi:hypothetical protein
VTCAPTIKREEPKSRGPLPEDIHCPTNVLSPPPPPPIKVEAEANRGQDEITQGVGPGRQLAITRKRAKRRACRPRKNGVPSANDAICSLCNVSNMCPDAEPEIWGNPEKPGETRYRRNIPKPRGEIKFGQWWQSFGYSGDFYCQRCSEVFRDHLMRNRSNSAACTRSSPCREYAQMLVFFPLNIWVRVDEKARRKRLGSSSDRAGEHADEEWTATARPRTAARRAGQAPVRGPRAAEQAAAGAADAPRGPRLWGPRLTGSWEENFARLAAYNEAHGDCNVPAR